MKNPDSNTFAHAPLSRVIETFNDFLKLRSKMMVPLLFFVCAIPAIVSGQDNESGKEQRNRRFSVYANNPLGILSKYRVKIEYRIKEQHSVLLSLTDYHGFTPGVQSYLEYRRYIEGMNGEYFLYGKAGAGKTYVYGGRYALFGVGFGQQVSFGKSKSFVIQISEGLKYCPVIDGDIEGDRSGGGFRGLFYITGPGAIFDLGINLGWRF